MARNTGGHYFDAGNRLAQDGCALQAREEGNVGVNDYLLTNFYAPGCSESRERVKEFAVQNVNLNTVEGYGVQPCHIDGDSSLRLVPPSHGRSRAQLHPREFQAVPDLSRGRSSPCVESELQQGTATGMRKPCDKYAEKSYDRFTPLLNRCWFIPSTYIPFPESSTAIMKRYDTVCDGSSAPAPPRAQSTHLGRL